MQKFGTTAKAVFSTSVTKDLPDILIFRVLERYT
jgi:hypothetical protein